jgi:hypothetical protein
MIILWLVTAAALVAAIAAYRRAQRTARKLEELTQLYWELRYQYGALRQEPQPSPRGAAGEAGPAAPGDQGQFIPLTSVKR